MSVGLPSEINSCFNLLTFDKLSWFLLMPDIRGHQLTIKAVCLKVAKETERSGGGGFISRSPKLISHEHKNSWLSNLSSAGGYARVLFGSSGRKLVSVGWPPTRTPSCKLDHLSPPVGCCRPNIHLSLLVLVFNHRVDTHLLSLRGWKAELTTHLPSLGGWMAESTLTQRYVCPKLRVAAIFGENAETFCRQCDSNLGSRVPQANVLRLDHCDLECNCATTGHGWSGWGCDNDGAARIHRRSDELVGAERGRPATNVPADRRLLQEILARNFRRTVSAYALV